MTNLSRRSCARTWNKPRSRPVGSLHVKTVHPQCTQTPPIFCSLLSCRIQPSSSQPFPPRHNQHPPALKDRAIAVSLTRPTRRRPHRDRLFCCCPRHLKPTVYPLLQTASIPRSRATPNTNPNPAVTPATPTATLARDLRPWHSTLVRQSCSRHPSILHQRALFDRQQSSSSGPTLATSDLPFLRLDLGHILTP